MPTRVLLTVDTELRWQPDPRRGWEESFARSYDPAGVGVPWQLGRLAAHGLSACFFVDPMPAARWGAEPIRRMIAPILEAGQEVQLHLHPQWEEGAPAFELTDLPEDDQRRLIATARDHLIAAGAPAPIAFRAGSYAADDATLRALASLGFRYDSSHNGSHQPWPSAVALPNWLATPTRHEGIIEVPVSLIEEGSKLRHLQLCAVSADEMRAAILHAAEADHPLVTIVSHSFELAGRSGVRPNTTHVRRFEALCSTLADLAAVAPTTRFDALGDLPLDVPARAFSPGSKRRFRRVAEQVWSNLVDERRR
ncbi:polysaccharide deacetylase family protein [Sphingomonas jatrophae]|uniref:Polysaccharide deacetylase n=1 Tax=Sphingomonas jatrophae TaxID=1166337 RepID=A0A1I6JLD4_9SPHN|nr:polysaccharide deacetylase family protein [Sphingomonas jatrophae]SFR79360.1 Polysaccharide deacetylase [Sphingomonas jatrophae]